MSRKFGIPFRFKELLQRERAQDLEPTIETEESAAEESRSQTRTQSVVIDNDVLSELGFDVQAFLGKGYHAEVFRGVCNKNATKLYQLDEESVIEENIEHIIWEFTKCEIDRSVVCRRTIKGYEKDDECEMCDISLFFEEISLEGKEIAVKYIDLSKVKPRKRTYGLSSAYSKPIDPLEEPKIIMSLSHENVVEVYNILTVNKNRLYIVMEMLEMSLNAWLHNLNRSGKRFTDEDIEYLLTATIEGLVYLHENQVIHNDIHAGNILIETESEKLISAKYVDFGLSEIIGDFNAPEYDIRDLGRVLQTVLDLVQFKYRDYERGCRKLVKKMCDGFYENSEQVLRDLENFKRFEL